MLYEIVVFVLGGALAGLMAGLLGIGGGLVVVPFLNFVLPHLNFPDEVVMHVAVATSLTIIVGTSISSILAHQRRGGILWQLVIKLLPGIVLGSLIATQIADLLSSSVLKLLFGLFVIFLGYRMAFKFKSDMHQDTKLPNGWKLTTSSMLIAGLCNLLGMGGGALLVPYFGHYNVPLRNAVATSAVCSFPIALAGVFGLIFASSVKVQLPAYTTGYVYWPAFIMMVIPSILMAPVGAKLAHVLPSDKLKRVFALFLVIVGIEMLSKSLIKIIHF